MIAVIACVSALCLAPSVRRWEVIVMAQRLTWASSGRRHVRNNWSPGSQPGWYVCGGNSSSSSSSWNKSVSSS